MPAGCLVPCPVCATAASRSSPSSAIASCPTCDIHCQPSSRRDASDATPAPRTRCDSLFGCINEPMADRTACDDANPCTTGDTARTVSASADPRPTATDGNVCTTTPACEHGLHAHAARLPGRRNVCYGPANLYAAHRLSPRPWSRVPPRRSAIPRRVASPRPATRTPTATTASRARRIPVVRESHGARSRLWADGTSCSDGDVVHGAETCQAGVCTPGTPPACDDPQACPRDGCRPIGVVSASPAAAARRPIAPAATHGTSCVKQPLRRHRQLLRYASDCAGRSPARPSVRHHPVPVHEPPPTAPRAATPVTRPTTARAGPACPGPRLPLPRRPATSARRLLRPVLGLRSTGNRGLLSQRTRVQRPRQCRYCLLTPGDTEHPHCSNRSIDPSPLCRRVQRRHRLRRDRTLRRPGAGLPGGRVHRGHAAPSTVTTECRLKRGMPPRPHGQAAPCAIGASPQGMRRRRPLHGRQLRHHHRLQRTPRRRASPP